MSTFPVLAIHSLFLFFAIFASDLSLDVGSGAASQLLRKATNLALNSPRPLQFTLNTHQQPFLSSLALIETTNRISYSNLTIKFSPEIIHLLANDVKLYSISNVSPNIWPVSFGDEVVDFTVQVRFTSFSSSF